jgi:hypothetical protein
MVVTTEWAVRCSFVGAPQGPPGWLNPVAPEGRIVNPIRVIGVLLLLLLTTLAHAADTGLVARYDFDDGQGTVAADRTGHGLDATLVGAAAWERGDFGTALRLNGTDSYVDCGSPAALNLPGAGSVSLWIKPQEPLQGGLFSWCTGTGWPDARLMLTFDTYHGAPQLLWVMADGKGYGSGKLTNPPVGAWTHMVLTWDGRSVRVYTDGVLANSQGQPLKPKLDGVKLTFGRALGLGKDIFNGLMDEAAVYSRPLTDLEVLALYKAEAGRRGKDLGSFTRPEVAATPDALSGRLLVQVSCGLMRPLPPGARVSVSVSRPGGKTPVLATEVPIPGGVPAVSPILDPRAEPPGQLVVRAQLRDAGGQPVGQPAQTTVDWPQRDPRFSPERGVKVLNNMCFELLNVTKPGTKTYTVNNPREGWLYLCVVPTPYNFGTVIPQVVVDDIVVKLRPVGRKWEAMRYLAEGPHRVRITVGNGEWADRFLVRAVGEYVYAMYGANPLVPETGNYTWQWLRQHCLDSYNVVIGPARMDFAADEIKEWTGEGRQWMTQRNLPFDMDVDGVVDYWTKEPGFAHPQMSGIWADEFYGGEKMQRMYPIWCEALRRIHADPRYRGKRFYAFTGSSYIADYDLLVKTLMACDYRIGAEWYVREVPSAADIEGTFGPAFERRNRAAWEAAAPEAAMSRLWVLGLLSQPEESCDIYPQCDYNVFLDLQMQFLATDPAFFGVRGLYGYYSPYVGEEQTRLMAALVRHYGLEGRTDRLLSGSYDLPHLQNPDFVAGLQGWQVSAATEGSVAPKVVERFGFLQGRYATNVGDTTAWTRRSAARPNTLSQELRDLQPGQPYSLRCFTGNYQDYLAGKSNPYAHAVAVSGEGARIVPDKCFQAVIKSNYAHKFGPFDVKNPYRMNYHQVVFIPQGKTAKLTLSDWKSPAQAGGPEGEELIWNFVQVQPYFAEAAK